MTQTINRRTFLKKIMGIGIGAVALSSFGYGYAYYIEPNRLGKTSITLQSPEIPQSFDGVTIIQFSDTHVGFHYSLSQLEDLIYTINELQADIILFTGDLLDTPNQFPYIQKVAPILERCQAPLGKYAIYGNHDHGGYGSDIYKNIMKEANFQLLKNEHVRLHYPNSSDYIVIAGLDDAMLGKPNVQQTIADLPDNTYSIMMAHEPDLADDLQHYSFNIQLSGHSHGGQVQIPFVGPLITPPFATKYVEGLYKLPNSNMILYVNRGIGTTRMPYRFLSTPEITVFTLKHGKHQILL